MLVTPLQGVTAGTVEKETSVWRALSKASETYEHNVVKNVRPDQPRQNPEATSAVCIHHY